MATFEVVGPFPVPTRRTRSGSRVVDEGALGAFWQEARCGERPGCYVFAIRHGRGALPYYAGRTYGRFDNECFEDHKLRKYDNVLADILRGTPLMFFLVHNLARGRVNRTAIASLEDTLIKIGLERNDRMTNISGTRTNEIAVRGVWGTGRGRRSVAATAFIETMGL